MTLERKVKLAAWLIGTVLFTAGTTLELTRGWAMFFTNLGTAIGLGFGVNIDFRKAARVAPLLLVLLAPGCHMPATVWPKLLQCAPDVTDLVAMVGRILLDGGTHEPTMGDRAKRELERLAVDNGADVVACTIDQLVRRWRSPGATVTPETMAAASRGERFLAEVGVREVIVR